MFKSLCQLLYKPIIYFRIYLAAIACGVSEATTYRIPLALMIVVEFLSSLCTLAAVYVLFYHLDSIGPWSKEYFLFFTCFALVIDQLHLALFADGFWVFSEMIRLRTLDYILIRPVSSIFAAIFTHVRPFMVVGMILPTPLLIYYGMSINLPLISWLLLPILLLLGLGLLIGIEMLLMCANFWAVDGYGLNYCRLQLQAITRWPDFIYQGAARKLLTVVVPLLVVVNSPVNFLTSPDEWMLILPLFIALILVWTIVTILWKVSLRRYE